MLLEPCVVFFSHCTRPLTFNWMFCNLSKDEGTVDDQTHPLRNLKYYGGLVAVPFLVATILIYSILPELRNTHGTTLRCYLFCLTLDNVTVAINRLSTPDYRAGTTCLCLGESEWRAAQNIVWQLIWFSGFVIYCASTASFLWLNVICFDLWLKFGWVKFLVTKFVFLQKIFSDLEALVSHSDHFGVTETSISSDASGCIVVERKWSGTRFTRGASLLQWPGFASGWS